MKKITCKGALFRASTMIIFLMAGLVSPAQIINVPANQPTIQAGINAASDGDTVLVDEGTYTENIRFNGKKITLGSQFLIDGLESHIENTIIDGSGATDPDSASTVMFINGEDTNSILNGFTITGGTGTLHKEYGVQNGGGINVFDAGAKIINNIITGNHVSGDTAGGAGIECLSFTGDYWVVIDNNTINYNTSTASVFSAFAGGISTLINSRITNNTIEYNTCTNSGGNADGGGIEIERISPSTSFYISGNTIRFNEISGLTNAMGGGIISLGCGAIIENNIIEGNSAVAGEIAWGGGIGVHSSASSVTIASNTIKDNYLEGDHAYGPGINLFNNIGMTLIGENEISNNSGYGYGYAAGGAVRLHTCLDKVSINDNRMYGNELTSDSHTSGGAIAIYPAGTHHIDILRNNIGYNSATNGGAIRTYNAFNISLINNLLYKNNASKGGAIRFYQTETDKMDQNNQMPCKYVWQDHQIISPINADTSFPVLINNTFMGNNADVRAGAIYATLIHGGMLVFNCIFWENEANYWNNIQNYSPQDMLIAWSDIDIEEVTGDWHGRYNIQQDPEFCDTLCHLIGPTSLCADGGADSVHYLENIFYSPGDDYEGEIRPYNNGIPDIGADETYVWVGLINERDNGEDILSVQQCHPNPFVNYTTFSFFLKKPGDVVLEIFDGTGKKIAEPLNQYLLAGEHQIYWKASGYPAGVYYYKIIAGKQSEVRKMVIR